MPNHFSIAIHGGAGTILRSSMTETLEKEYKTGLEEALDAAYALLNKGRSALDAVEIAVRILEDNPLFNAGKGSVFNAAGKHEMDASIMDGMTLKAGAVALIQNVKNPISLARLVMDKTDHVFLAGPGALAFADEMQVEQLSDDYFYSKQRFDQWQFSKQENKVVLDHFEMKETKFGTVGAVALDQQGNLAAATSTGGMTNKKYGRVGDTPMIGAGTYANNLSCAVSCTGSGEFFMRTNAAFHIHSLMFYAKLDLDSACTYFVQKILMDIGGDGGLIAIDKFGSVSLSFNTEGMYRAYAKSNGEKAVMIYGNEE